VVTTGQLLAHGLTRKGIAHRVAKGRLHPVHRGVYAVGRPQLTQHGHWMAAVLACGSDAALSHEHAAALLGIRHNASRPVDVTVGRGSGLRRPDIAIHRRRDFRPGEIMHRRGIPVTTPVCTLVDLATRIGKGELEAAVNEADRLELVSTESLRSALAEIPRRPGVAVLRRLLDRQTFTLTDSELERRFLPLARRAGLSRPRTRAWLNGYRVDFHWPDLGLVVETDGLRYHRTPAQQLRDRRRDQAHAAAGLTPMRFTRAQVAFEPDYVVVTLAAVVERLRASRYVSS
jgi:very-short-patch-repair endonuclease